jgi:hypothetical protein
MSPGTYTYKSKAKDEANFPSRLGDKRVDSEYELLISTEQATWQGWL